MKILVILLLLAGISGICGIGELPKYQAGGICFRMDDNQNPQKWQDVAAVFNRHKLKLCASLNIRRMGNPHFEMLKRLQLEGHEVMDHSPLHCVTKIKFAPGKTAKDYQNLPGVDHIVDNNVYLSYVMPSSGDCKIRLKVRLAKDTLTLIDKPDGKIARELRNARVLYIPAEKRVLQLSRSRNPLEYKLKSIWDEKNVNEKARETEACFLRDRNFSMTPEAIELLGRNSLDLFASIGAKRPYTWIQPGGGVSSVSSDLAAKVLGKRLGYKSAATYINKSLKVFKEYNPNGTCAFGMMWGDFDEEKHDLKWNKTRIADLVALHHVAIGHSHMHPKDGWDKYLQRLDQLLAWCVAEKIPVRTQAEWADLLYSTAAKSKDNDYDVFPSLKIDRDGNGRPDGYQLKRASWDRQKQTITGLRRGEMFAVKNLAGLYKGKNRLTFSVDTDTGCQVKVTVSFPGTNNRSQEKTFSFQKGGDGKCTWDFDIPANASLADFSWQLMNDGKCKISKISLRKK